MGMTKDEFCARFKAYIVERAGFEKFDDDEEGPGESVSDYAEATAPTYWEQYVEDDSESPEEHAAADMSYWGE
jgi:hypothetical protein